MRRLVFGFAAVAACGLAADSAAQPPPPGLPSPRLANVFPPGAKVGAAVDVVANGFDLDEPTGLLFSHPGITGEYAPPKDPPADPKAKAPPPAKKKGAPPSGPHPFKVAVGAGVPPGVYDVRAVGKWGVSNPRAFAVGDLPEVVEKEPNNDVPEAQRVEVGTTVNGLISSGTDVDYTVFAAKKGQRVVVSCLASALDSRAKPMVEVFDPAGRKLALNRGYRDADAVTDFVAPADGDYYVRLFEFTYLTGTPDHVYRLTISAAPWIDGVFPNAVEPGKPAQVTLYGRNLPGGTTSEYTIDGRPLEQATVTITPPADPLAAQRLTVRDRVDPVAALGDGFEYRVKGPGGTSNAVAISFAREKVVVKKAATNTKPEAAEAIPAPCEVAGMLGKKGDRDWYSFDAKKGDGLFIELTGERGGSPADFYFTVHDAANKFALIGAEQDDDPDILHPTDFYSRTADPAALKLVAPADGKYVVGVGCREAGSLSGPPTAYRLRVGPPRPDFRAVAKAYGKTFQAGSAARQDGTEALDVYVHRLDGFAGPVTVTAEGLPAGVTAKPLTVGPAARWGVLVFNIAAAAAPFTGTFTLKATAATADGKPLVREVRPVTVVWGNPQPGQNTPVLARLAQSFALAVRPEKGFFKLTADPAAATIKTAAGKDEKAAGPLVVKPGDKVTLPVKVLWLDPDKQPVTLAADPTALAPQNASFTVAAGTQPTKDKPEGTVTLDVKPTAPPGVYSVVIRGDSPVPFVRDPVAKAKANVPASAFADPVEVLVLPAALAKVTSGALPNGTVKLGMTGELTIKVERLHDFAGEFTVKFVPPTGVTGVTAADVVIAAGKDEAKLVVKAAADAKPGAVAGSVVVTAVYAGKYPVAHDAKVSFNVAK